MMKAFKSIDPEIPVKMRRPGSLPLSRLQTRIFARDASTQTTDGVQLATTEADIVAMDKIILLVLIRASAVTTTQSESCSTCCVQMRQAALSHAT